MDYERRCGHACRLQSSQCYGSEDKIHYKQPNFWIFGQSKPSQFLPRLGFIRVFYGVEVGLADDAGFIFILLRLVLLALWYVFVVRGVKDFAS